MRVLDESDPPHPVQIGAFYAANPYGLADSGAGDYDYVIRSSPPYVSLSVRTTQSFADRSPLTVSVVLQTYSGRRPGLQEQFIAASVGPFGAAD